MKELVVKLDYWHEIWNPGQQSVEQEPRGLLYIESVMDGTLMIVVP